MDFFSKKSIENLELSLNSSGWGPLSGEKLDIFGEIPYAHFDKKEKIGRHADFISTQSQMYQRAPRYRNRDEPNVNAEFQYRVDVVEDASFQLVDNTNKTARRKLILVYFVILSDSHAV
jgi:hypothetical protein